MRRPRTTTYSNPVQRRRNLMTREQKVRASKTLRPWQDQFNQPREGQGCHVCSITPLGYSTPASSLSNCGPLPRSTTLVNFCPVRSFRFSSLRTLDTGTLDGSRDLSPPAEYITFGPSASGSHYLLCQLWLPIPLLRFVVYCLFEFIFDTPQRFLCRP